MIRKVIVKMLQRFLKEAYSLAWTLAGTGLVLITLSGSTRFWGTIISLGALAVHLLAVAFLPEDDL